ncbi:hypothetical protein B0H13DRAFT_2680511 [Mycena leptocephala]|nr:hypothetical protein B0H13DRAFT_2680511 [Mycena leptocephala]
MSTARPPKAPPLTSMPSTPGPQVPGGYPRNSVVFSANQWDRAPPQTQSQTEAKTGFLAATKAYLPPAVASYFPTQSSNTTTSSSEFLSPAANSAGDTPGVALHTDGSTSSASNFSTRAYAGSGSSRGTLTPTQGQGAFPTGSDSGSTFTMSGVDSTANSDPDQRRTSTATATTTPTTVDSTLGPEARRVEPLPSVAPFASVLTSAVARPAPAPAPQPNSTRALDPPAATTTPASPASSGSGSGSGFSSNASASTAPSSPASHEKGFSASVKRFASLRTRRGEKGTGKGAGTGAPPSAFGGAGHVRGSSLDTTTASGADSPDDANPHVTPTEKLSRRASLLRTLRGEASVLAGRVRGDRERVERGKRMIHGEV